MRVFVTGASGFIGSATVSELLAHGHEVVGLARSEASADRIRELGATPHTGNLDDIESVVAGAREADAVVHLGYNHDFSQMPAAAATDRAVIDAIGAEYAGTDRALLIASGTLGLAPGRVGTETDRPDAAVHPRVANGDATLALADRGVRSIVTRFAPTVHGEGDHGFIRVLADVARDKGVAAYIGEGANRWPAVHRLDAARLVRLAIESAPAGSVVHAVAEEGITTRAIAEAIGRQLDVPVQSIAAEDAAEHFGWIGMFFGADAPASSAATRTLLNWEPTHQGLVADLDAGFYTTHVAAAH
jgi:nucleoside-diphosphate-sugar epimerase